MLHLRRMYQLTLDPTNFDPDLYNHEYVIHTEVVTVHAAKRRYGNDQVEQLDLKSLPTVGQLMPIEQKFYSLTGGTMFPEMAHRSKAKGMVVHTVMVAAIQAALREGPDVDDTHYMLTELLFDDSDEVGLAAATALGNCKNIANLEVIEDLKHCSENHPNEKVKQAALESLEEIAEDGKVTDDLGVIFEEDDEHDEG